MNDQQRESTAKYMYDLSKGGCSFDRNQALMGIGHWRVVCCFRIDCDVYPFCLGLFNGREEVKWIHTGGSCFLYRYLQE